MMLDPVIAWSLRIALALLFATAAWHKLSDRRRFEGSIRAYRLAPSAWAPLLAWLLPLVEGAVALGLLHPPSHRTAAVAAAATLSIYTVAVAVNLARGQRDIDCGCFASTATVPLSPGLVGRNLGLIVGSSILLMPVHARTFVWVDVVTIAAVLTTLSLLWTAAQRLAQTGPALRRFGGP